MALPVCSPRTGPKMRCEADAESFKMVPKYQLPGRDGGPKFYRRNDKTFYAGTLFFGGAGQLGLAKGRLLNEREHISELERTSKKLDSCGIIHPV